MHQLQFFRASGRLPRRFFWIGVLLLLILLSCAVFVSVLLAGVARSATGSETVYKYPIQYLVCYLKEKECLFLSLLVLVV